MYAERVLSGMRPTGRLHLGHYHGVLKNWVRLQHEYPCLFFVAALQAAAQVVHDDLCAFLGCDQRAVAANAIAASGDQNNFSVKCAH